MKIPSVITKLVKYIFRFFGFSIGRFEKNKIIEKKIVFITVGKFTIEIDNTNPLCNIFITNPRYSSELGRLVKIVFDKYPSLVVLDIGANIGDTLALIKSAADIPVICIEGDSYCFDFLKKNSSQFDNVKLYNQYLGEFTQNITAKLDKKGWNTTILPNSQDEGFESIDLISLDDFFLKEKVVTKDIKIIKTDTEGFDLLILRGGINFISSIKPVLYMEYNRDNMFKINEDGLSTLLKFSDLGYDMVLIYDPAGRFILSTSIRDVHLITQLHNYIDGHYSYIHYFDLCIFHQDDHQLAVTFLKAEELTSY